MNDLGFDIFCIYIDILMIDSLIFYKQGIER